MTYKAVFSDRDEAWEFAKNKVANGGTVIDYGVEEHKGTRYYIKYIDSEEIQDTLF